VKKDAAGLAAWCFFDWANSAFPTVIVTFVFAAYFTQSVASDVISGTAQWGYAISLSALAVAVAGPFFGAIADSAGPRKPWLLATTLIAVCATALLWFVEPDVAFVLSALVLVALANFAFEAGMVFYNAMLADLVAPSRIGRMSGWGWGLGYGGGLACLAIALFTLVQPEQPWFGLDKAMAEPLRATALLAAAWFGLFAMPLFFLTPDSPSKGLGVRRAMFEGIETLLKTAKNIRKHANIIRYLIARMIYTDGLNTLFIFGGIYAAGTFSLGFSDLIVFGIAMNVMAGLGATGFAWLDDLFGPKRVILLSVLALSVLTGVLLFVEQIHLFWIAALSLGIFVGPAQAASRSLMAQIAPQEMRAEMFGLYAFSGKATAFVGPAVVAFVTESFDSQRAGMATIIVFFVVGLALMKGVPDPRTPAHH
jgi:MFS transporter, UMF1 family